jgi:16S rRNA G966 N2-methylase RsmD
MDIFNFLKTCTEQYNFIFAGPPYALGPIDEIPKIIVQQKIIAPDGFFVLEHTPRNNYEKFDGFSFVRNYGTTLFSFFVCS